MAVPSHPLCVIRRVKVPGGFVTQREPFMDGGVQKYKSKYYVKMFGFGGVPEYGFTASQSSTGTDPLPSFLFPTVRSHSVGRLLLHGTYNRPYVAEFSSAGQMPQKAVSNPAFPSHRFLPWLEIARELWPGGDPHHISSNAPHGNTLVSVLKDFKGPTGIRGLCFHYLPIGVGGSMEPVYLFVHLDDTAAGGSKGLVDKLSYKPLDSSTVTEVGTVDYSGLLPNSTHTDFFAQAPTFPEDGPLPTSTDFTAHEGDAKAASRISWPAHFNESRTEFSFIVDAVSSTGSPLSLDFPQGTSVNANPGFVISVGFDLAGLTVGAPVLVPVIQGITLSNKVTSSVNTSTEWSPAWPRKTASDVLDGIDSFAVDGPTSFNRSQDNSVMGTTIIPLSVGYVGDELHCIYYERTYAYSFIENHTEFHPRVDPIPPGGNISTFSSTSTEIDNQTHKIYSTVWKAYQIEADKGAKTGLILDLPMVMTRTRTLTESTPLGEVVGNDIGKQLCHFGVIKFHSCNAATGAVILDYSHLSLDEEFHNYQGPTRSSLLNTDRVLHRRFLVTRSVPPRYLDWPNKNKLVVHLVQDSSDGSIVSSTGLLSEDVSLYPAGLYLPNPVPAGAAPFNYTSRQDDHKQLGTTGPNAPHAGVILGYEDHVPQPRTNAAVITEAFQEAGYFNLQEFRIADSFLVPWSTRFAAFHNNPFTNFFHFMPAPHGQSISEYQRARSGGMGHMYSGWAPAKVMVDIYGNVIVIFTEAYRETTAPFQVPTDNFETQQWLWINGENMAGKDPHLDTLLQAYSGTFPFNDQGTGGLVVGHEAFRERFPLKLYRPGLAV